MQTSTITQTTISVTITSIPAQTVNISIYTIIICYKNTLKRLTLMSMFVEVNKEK